ncbi:MAG: metallophosphoesterase [Acidaminobacteraceae bacterium]
MKRIGIISDSHHSEENLIKVIEKLKDVDMILHLGDNISDCDIIRRMLNVEVYGVLGNCDVGKDGLKEQILIVEGKRIFMTHGHKYNVKHSLNRLFYKASELEADIVLFGHTHYALNAVENSIIFFNPGSITSPRASKDKTYGVLEIGSNGMKIYHKLLV